MIDLTPAKFGRKVARRIGQKTCTKACRLCMCYLSPASPERKWSASAHSGGGGEQEKCFDSRLCALRIYECVRPSREMRRRHLFIFTFLRTRSLGLWSEPDLTQTNSRSHAGRCLLINLIGSRALIDEFN
jgi:hypothetical protein